MAPNFFRHVGIYLDTVSARGCFSMGLAGSLLLGVLDYLTGQELSFSVFYTVPIMLSAWYGGKAVGLTVSILSAGIWLCADLAGGGDYSSLLVPAWNSIVRLSFFIIILWLLLIVRAKLMLEESLADTDPLTGMANRRSFQEQLEREYARVRRYPKPFTIAYIDLDNFKYVNDSMGHDVGDELLLTIAQSLLKGVRASDFAARLGGDEFAVLLPMLGKESALSTLEKLSGELLCEMEKKQWPVTFSIGAVTFYEAMDSSRDMVKLVDDLMYAVKKSGKNNIRYIVWPEAAG